jgi:hypothetical protein
VDGLQGKGLSGDEMDLYLGDYFDLKLPRRPRGSDCTFCFSKRYLQDDRWSCRAALPGGYRANLAIGAHLRAFVAERVASFHFPSASHAAIMPRPECPLATLAFALPIQTTGMNIG